MIRSVWFTNCNIINKTVFWRATQCSFNKSNKINIKKESKKLKKSASEPKIYVECFSIWSDYILPISMTSNVLLVVENVCVWKKERERGSEENVMKACRTMIITILIFNCDLWFITTFEWIELNCAFSYKSTTEKSQIKKYNRNTLDLDWEKMWQPNDGHMKWVYKTAYGQKRNDIHRKIILISK